MVIGTPLPPPPDLPISVHVVLLRTNTIEEEVEQDHGALTDILAPEERLVYTSEKPQRILIVWPGKPFVKFVMAVEEVF